MKQRIVIIGNGMAADRFVSSLIEKGSSLYSITIVGEETNHSYNRTLLSSVLSKQLLLNNIHMKEYGWYWDNKIKLLLGKGKKVEYINRNSKSIICIDGTEVQYDKLILATGSSPIRIPSLDNGSVKSLYYYRNIDDVRRIDVSAKNGASAVVVGAGLLGLEVAEVLSDRGMNITVVNKLPTALDKQLDKTSGSLLQMKMEQKGIVFKMNTEIHSLESSGGKVKRVHLKDGSIMNASMVVVAIGIQPNIQLAKQSGIQCDKGVLVDNTMQTSESDIFAIGECTQFHEQTFGFVTPLFQQADVLAQRLYGITAKFSRKEFAVTLKVSGVQVFSMGDIFEQSQEHIVVYHDPFHLIYKKLVIKHNKLVGIVLFGDLSGAKSYQYLLEHQVLINSDMRAQLIFDHHELEVPSPIDVAA